jgi:hypothetical protein
VLGAAWSIPVIALAVAAPAAAASTDPQLAVTCADPRAGVFTIIGSTIVIKYRTAPDIYEANIHFANGGSVSFGTNYGTGPGRGATTWTITLPAAPAWVQVHGFDVHYGEPTCPVPAGIGGAR